MILLMLVKRAVYYVLAAGPFLLIGLIAINSRLNMGHWEFVEYGPEASRRIEAYVEPVRSVQSNFVQGQPVSAKARRDTANLWLSAYWAGDLEEIAPPTAVYDGITPIYEQILRARDTVTNATVREGDRLGATGEADQAALLYTDAYELAQIGKFSEFAALAESSITQTHVLQKIAALAPQLSEPDRLLILGRISREDADPSREIVAMVNRFAVAYSLDMQRQGESEALIELARGQARLVSNEDPLEAKIEALQQLSVSDKSLVSLYGRSRVAYRQFQKSEEQLAVTVAALGDPASSN